MEKDDWIGRARSVGGEFQAELRARFGDHPLVGEIRGDGLIAGVELVANKSTKEAFDPADGVGRRLHLLAKAEGLITRAMVDTMAFSPPLVITRDEIGMIFERFETALGKLEAELRADGTWSGA